MMGTTVDRGGGGRPRQRLFNAHVPVLKTSVGEGGGAGGGGRMGRDNRGYCRGRRAGEKRGDGYSFWWEGDASRRLKTNSRGVSTVLFTVCV